MAKFSKWHSKKLHGYLRISWALNFLRGPRFLDEDTAPEMSRDEKSTFSKIIGAHWKERAVGT